jgi:5'-nucleotidase
MVTRLILAGLFLVAAALPGRAEVPLTILHTSEHHGTLQPIGKGPFEGLGGMARRAALIEQIRKQARHVLLVDSGDLLVGSAMSSVFRGVPDVSAMNLMRYDGLAVGNHDFDFGVEHLRALRKAARFPFLCTNIRLKGRAVCQRFAIKSVGPLRVGLIGLVGQRSFPDLFNRSVIREVEFHDPVRAAKAAATELHQLVDLLVAITHQETEEDRDLARSVPELTIIVGGHTAGFDGLLLAERATPLLGVISPFPGGPILVKTHQQGRTLGRLDLLYEKGIRAAEARNLPVDANLPEEKKVSSLVRDYARRLEAVSNRLLGQALVSLEGESAELRTRETNLGNLLADLARSETRTDIALVNSGLIRSSIPSGPVTLKRVMEVLPYDGSLVSFRLTGRQLWEALENSVSQLPKASGRFLQLSGLSFLFDPSQPVGSRVKEVLVHGAALDPDRSYSVVADQFIAEGGDGYAVFLQGRERLVHQTLLRDLLSSALKSAPLSAREEGRVRQGNRQ